MPAQTNRIDITLETALESVSLAEEMSQRVAGVAGFGDEECHRIGMSVREGVINAFHYGNCERRDKKIQVAFELTPEKMVIHIVDGGRGFNLADVPDPLAEENLLKTSGRGIFLMRAFMDEFEVARGAQGGAEVIMAKRFPQARPVATKVASAKQPARKEK
jgi:serine/threonine-protein kinase RsbW